MNTLPAGYKMSDKAAGHAYMLYIAAGWTEEQLIELGYIELIHPKKTVADTWECFEGVWPYECRDGGYWYKYNTSYKSSPTCTREQFESYGRKRKVEADKTVNAMVQKFEAAKGTHTFARIQKAVHELQVLLNHEHSLQIQKENSLAEQRAEVKELCKEINGLRIKLRELSQVKLNLEKTIQNLTTLTGTKEPKNDD